MLDFQTYDTTGGKAGGTYAEKLGPIPFETATNPDRYLFSKDKNPDLFAKIASGDFALQPLVAYVTSFLL